MRIPALLSVITLGGLTLCWTSCSSPAPTEAAAPAVDMAALTAQIQAAEDGYCTAFMAKDPDAVAAYYSDDAVSFSREREPARGRAAIRERLAEGIAKDTLGVTTAAKVLELYVGTDEVTEIGTWTDTNKDGTEKDHGTYFSVFKKKGDKWECIRDISVSHKPKEEAAPAAVPQP